MVDRGGGIQEKHTRYPYEVHVWFRSKRVKLREVSRPRGLVDKAEDKMAESTVMSSRSMSTSIRVSEIHEQKTRSVLLLKFVYRVTMVVSKPWSKMPDLCKGKHDSVIDA
jgi:hypothetical protein